MKLPYNYPFILNYSVNATYLLIRHRNPPTTVPQASRHHNWLTRIDITVGVGSNFVPTTRSAFPSYYCAPAWESTPHPFPFHSDSKVPDSQFTPSWSYYINNKAQKTACCRAADDDGSPFRDVRHNLLQFVNQMFSENNGTLWATLGIVCVVCMAYLRGRGFDAFLPDGAPSALLSVGFSN